MMAKKRVIEARNVGLRVWLPREKVKKHVIITLIDQCAIATSSSRVPSRATKFSSISKKYKMARRAVKNAQALFLYTSSRFFHPRFLGGSLEATEREVRLPRIGRLPDRSSSGRDCSILGRNVEKRRGEMRE